VLGFVRALRRPSPPLITDAQAPPAVVILCLRGTDPYLADCLRGLLAQDYPNYQIRIIIDHPDDPAHAVVASALQATSHTLSHTNNAPPASIEFLQEKLPTCSLKCSSLLQVAQNLDPQVHFIAQLDADTIVHPTWLRELATALADPKVGAATGNRWYMPHRPSVGALVRYTWNAAAIVQMYWYQIAWGGTLAIKTSVLRETDVLQKWSRAFCEDTMLFAVLKKVGLRVAFVPQLMMINREDCHLASFYHWVKRQLLTARLYHPAWLGVLAHGIFTTLLPLAGLLLIACALLTKDFTTAWQTALILAAYQVSLALLLLPMEYAVQKLAQSRGEPTRWLSPLGILKCLVILPLTQAVYATVLGPASWTRKTDWRGIDYQVKGPWQIKMQGYHPYTTNPDESNPSNSL